jgi:DNA anti-recombination protein RmuC
MNQDRLNRSAAEISALGTELYGEIARFASNFTALGNRLKSTVSAYNSALPGLDRFIVSKSRRLKLLGAAKGDEPTLPDSVEVEVRTLTSDELSAAASVVDILEGDVQNHEGNLGAANG